MKVFIFIFTIIIGLICYPTEYNVIISSPFDSLIYSSSAHYSDSVYYQAFIEKGISDNEVYMNYVIGDTIMSSQFVSIDTIGQYSKQIEIASDAFGRCHIVWNPAINYRSSILYTNCSDTSFLFSISYVIDSFRVSAANDEWLEYPDIDVSNNGRYVGVAFTRIFATEGIIDSSWIELTVSSDGGTSFPPPKKVTFSSNRLQNPKVQMNDSTIFVLFEYKEGLLTHLNVLKLSPPYTTAEIFSVDNLHLNPTMTDMMIKDTLLFFTYSAFNEATNNMNIVTARRTIEGTALDNYFINPMSRNQLHSSIMINNIGEQRIFYADSILGSPFIMISSYSTIDDTFYTDWVFGLADFEVRRRFYPIYSNDIDYFLSGLISAESRGYILSCRSKPDLPPGPIENLTINSDTLSQWYSSENFVIDWTNPFDQSGIMKTLYKNYSPPIANFDTSGSTIDTSLTFNLPSEGVESLFLWDVDNRMNTNYKSNRFAIMKFDSSVPLTPRTISPADNELLFNESRSIPFSLANCFDSISGLAEYKVFLAYGTDISSSELYSMYDSNFVIDTAVVDTPFMDGLYTWKVETLDSAGNMSSSIEYNFTLMGTPKPTLVLPDNEDSIVFPYEFSFHPILGYDNAILSYKVEVSNDSLFGSTFYEKNIEDTFFTVDSLTNEKAYWRVIPINQGDFYCTSSETRIFYKSNVISGDFEITGDIPPQIRIGDTLHIKIIPNMPQCYVAETYLALLSGDTIELNEFLTESIPGFIYSNTSITGISDTVGTIKVICTPDWIQYDTVIKQIGIIYPLEWIREEDVILYPNPCSGDSINLKIISYKNVEVLVNTYDFKGNIISNDVFNLLAGERNMSIKLDAEFESDLYFMRIEVISDDETKIFKRKFVKVR